MLRAVAYAADAAKEPKEHRVGKDFMQIAAAARKIIYVKISSMNFSVWFD